MLTSNAATGLTYRAVVRCGLLLSAFVALASLAACGLSRPLTGAATDQPLRYPRDASRFIVEPLTDSTLSFAADEARWITPGMPGIAVDPARSDALVAKLEITSVDNGRVVALVTGQTTRVASGHVVLLVQPPRPWYRQRLYWIGSLSGALVVGGLTLLLI